MKRSDYRIEYAAYADLITQRYKDKRKAIRDKFKDGFEKPERHERRKKRLNGRLSLKMT